MRRESRYKVIDLIGQGDYATVYRGYDQELNREVAIKQIHPQYLNDPRQLERYWQEAKLLASLEHPYIMTIYDVVRERGWLILELMQGSLEQKLSGQPIDLEDLRLTIVYMCHALGFLQKNGIVHGDVKPSNLMLDRNHRIKLGDFGIARRLASSDGSVIKGTTKFMAPEVVSDQFGSVGHHSDLYSLGFSAYALMCGDQFDALFPGLYVTGRDEQIAWMMWHSAPDRQVPEIDKVLEGVPLALTRSIQKLTAKNPANRYQSSEQVIADLKAHAEGKDPEELSAAALAAREQQQRKLAIRRRWTYSAVAASVCLSLAMMFFGPTDKSPKPIDEDGYYAGLIASIDPARSLIGISSTTSATAEQGVELNVDRDRIYLNDRRVSLDELLIGDTIKVERVQSAKDDTYYLVEASRPPENELLAEILEVRGTQGLIVVNVEPELPGDEASDETSLLRTLEVYVPTNVPIQLNGRDEWDGHSVQVKDLRKGDRVLGRYVEDDGRNTLRQLVVTRRDSETGRLHTVNRDRKSISFEIGSGNQKTLRTYSIAKDCQVTINQRQRLANGQQVGIADLRVGDHISIQHDDQVHVIEVERELASSGTVESIHAQQGRLNVLSDSLDLAVSFQVTPDTLIGLATTGEPRELPFIRVGDRVVIEHESVDLIDPVAQVIRIEPKLRTDTWAILVTNSRFDAEQVLSIPNGPSDATTIEQSLENWYRVPAYQVRRIENPTRLTLLNELEEFLIDVPTNAQLIVYVFTRGFITTEGVPILATREFEPKRMEETGLGLHELIQRLEQATTGETMLLLDVGHLGMDGEPWEQPSAEELVNAVKLHASHPVSGHVEVLGSCAKGERNQLTRAGDVGVFADSLAKAWEGGADQNGDSLIESREVASYLAVAIPQRTSDTTRSQTAVRFAPGEKPDRLQPETIAEVEELLTYLNQPRFSSNWSSRFEGALSKQPDQPDVAIAYALVHLRHGRTSESRSKFEDVRARFPNRFVPHLTLAWQYLLAKDVDSAAVELTKGLGTLPTVQRPVSSEVNVSFPEEPFEKERFAELIGRLAGYATCCADQRMSTDALTQLEEAAKQLPPDSGAAYRRGFASVEDKAMQLDERLREATSQERDRLQRERARLSTYVQLDFELMADFVRAQLAGP